MFGWFKKTKEVKEQVRDWEDYKGFRICAAPISEGGQYRIGGIIEKDGEDVQSHSFIRADLIPTKDEANEFSLLKARLMVDQLGDRVFDS